MIKWTGDSDVELSQCAHAMVSQSATLNLCAFNSDRPSLMEVSNEFGCLNPVAYCFLFLGFSFSDMLILKSCIFKFRVFLSKRLYFFVKYGKNEFA